MPYIGNIVQDFSVNNAMLNTDSVTSIKIDDGTIVNADINDSAAIAGTKISPDFGTQAISTTGTGSTLGRLTISNVNPFITLTDTNNDSDFSIRGASGNFIIRDDTNGAARLTVGSSGNVGIGTSSPTFSTFGSNTGGIEISDVGSGANALLVQSSSNEFFFANTSSANYIYGADNAPLIISTNGSERMRIKSNGTVGIGTTNPSAKLDVKSTGDNIDEISLIHSGNTVKIASLGQISSHGSLALRTNSGTLTVRLSATTESSYINSGGNFGIGTSSPDQLLHINKTSGTTLFKASVASNSTIGLEIQKTGSTTQSWRIADGQTVNGKLEFYDVTDSATRMCIDGSGNVGIGTTSPRNKLDITGSIYASNGAQIQITGTPGGKGLQLIGQDDGTSLIGTMGSSGEHLLFRTASNERMRIDTSGRLLVGTSTASTAGNSQYSLFEVSGNTSGTTSAGHLSIKRGEAVASLSNGDTLGRLIFSGLDGGDFAYIQAAVDAAPGSNDYPGRLMVFTGNDGSGSPTERLRIDSSGNVGIGTTSPTCLLNVNTPASGTTTALEISRTTHGTVGKFINSTGALEIQSNKQLILSSDPAQGMTAAGSKIEFKIDAAEKATLTSDGNLTITDGDLIIGTNGHGIDFSATGDGGGVSGTTMGNELLNDYEEGSFTGGFNDFNGTYAQNTGQYVKIGNFVCATIMLQGSGGSGSGDLKLTNLPFASDGVTIGSLYRSVGNVFAYQGLVTGGLEISAVITNNTSHAILTGTNNNAVATTLNRNGLNSNAWEVQITVTYHTNS